MKKIIEAYTVKTWKNSIWWTHPDYPHRTKQRILFLPELHLLNNQKILPRWNYPTKIKITIEDIK